MIEVDSASSNSDFKWVRTDTDFGFVLYDQTKSDQLFVSANLDGASVTSSKLDALGYAHAEGENGVEWFLFDAKRLLSLQRRAEIDSLIWKLDAVERRKLGLDQNKQRSVWGTILTSLWHPPQ